MYKSQGLFLGKLKYIKII